MENDDRDELLYNDHQQDHVYSQSINTQRNSPKDKFYIVHTTFFLVGLSQLLPWNFLVTATGYWMYKFRDLHNSSHSFQFDRDNKSQLQTYFDSYLSIASNVPFLLVFGISFIGYLKRISDTRKNSVTFVSIIAVFITITSFVLVNTDKYQHAFLQLTLALVFFLNSAAAYLQGNFAGTVSLFPEKCMHLMVTGQATSGIFAASAQILSLVGNWSIVESTFVYFLFADITVLFTFVLYLLVRKTAFYQFYSSQIFLTEHSEEDSFTVVNVGLFKRVFKNMWPFCLTLMVTFWATLSAFPALVVLITPQDDQKDSFWSGKFFLPICCFFTFNACDFLGRFLGRYFMVSKERGSILLAIALSRIGFVPLLMFCNLYPRHLPVLFSSEIFYTVFIVIFGLSNGYLVLNVFINGPLSVSPEFRKVSGFFLIFFLGLGLTFGSLTSTILVRIL